MNQKVSELLRQMTLEEKIGQLTQTFSGEILDYKINSEHRDRVNLGGDKIFNIGSISGLGNPSQMMEIQNLVNEKSRLKIPVLNMMDVIHGFDANYQIALGLGCSFDPEQVRELSRISGYEAALNGVNVSYTPMADLTNDPRWGRFMEVPSEDTLICCDYTKAIVEGFQNDLNAPNGDVAACVKHFAGYGLAEGGRDYGAADVSLQQLYDKYYKAYRAGINAGTKLVMTAFNTLDGIACTGNYNLLRNVLRDEFGFDGVIISDHSSIPELVSHGIASDEREAAKIAIQCGVDIELATTCYAQHLQDLVESGDLDVKYVNDSVARVLALKFELGLFDNKYCATDEKKALEYKNNEVMLSAYKKASIDSFVLLKNDNDILPLKDNEIKFVGTHFDNKDLIGFNACNGLIDDVETIKEYFKKNIPSIDGVQIDSYTEITSEDIDLINKEIENVNTIVMPIGEQSRWSGEGVSRANIKLPKSQIELVKNIYASGKKIVAVIFAGRPLDLTDIIDYVDAIVYAWFPGHTTAPALFDVLFGKENFSGKLSCSMPRDVGQIPVYYNHMPTGREKQFLEQEYVNGYMDLPNSPLFEFGFGLSYSKFEYGDITQTGPLSFMIPVKNISNRDGVEITQLYIRDLVADVSRPVKELKAYKKTLIKANETVDIEFTLTHEDLKYYNNHLVHKYDAGEFEIMIGTSSETTKKIKVFIK